MQITSHLLLLRYTNKMNLISESRYFSFASADTSPRSKYASFEHLLDLFRLDHYNKLFCSVSALFCISSCVLTLNATPSNPNQSSTEYFKGQEGSPDSSERQSYKIFRWFTAQFHQSVTFQIFSQILCLPGTTSDFYLSFLQFLNTLFSS